MVANKVKVIVNKGDSGAAVEDVQRKLNKLGYIKDSSIDSFYGDATAAAVLKFSEDQGLAPTDEVTEKVWAKLVDASFKLGDRNLFLRMPYFHGNDVLELQKALGALGFQVRTYDGIFATSTERALRRFQINMGLPSDGIVGSQTFMVLKNLRFTWSDKAPLHNEKNREHNVFWRASEVLENNSICLYGTNDFTRDVADRMSNLARATNPFSKVLCSNAFSVAPDKKTMLLHIVLPEEKDNSEIVAPRVLYIEHDNIDDGLDAGSDIYDKLSDVADMKDLEDQDSFVIRLINALTSTKEMSPARLSIEIPGKTWMDAGHERSAQHYAISLLDALCAALNRLEGLEKVNRGNHD